MDTKSIGPSVTSFHLQTLAVQASPQQQAQENNLQPTKVNPAKESQNNGVTSQQYDADASNQSRIDVIKQLVKERYSYPLGEYYRITIYKESGQYVTMETSLKDGKVTYIPEQQVLNQGNTSVNSRGIITQA